MGPDAITYRGERVQLVRRRQVEQLVQLSRSTIYAGVKAGTFPAPVRLGIRAVAWRLFEVEAWVEARLSTTQASIRVSPVPKATRHGKG